MLEMRIEHLVSGIVSRVLLEVPYRERDLTKGLLFSFDFSLSSYEESGEYGVRCGLHLVYHAPHNYVTVFSGITESCFGSPKDVKEWTHESSHDSCWRDISFFSQVYFNAANEVNEQRKKDGLKPIAPKDMNQNTFFQGIGRDAWRWIPVEITKDIEDPNYYRRLLKVL